MKKLKRIMALAMAVLMTASALTGCGQANSGASSAAPKASANSAKPYDGVTLHYAVSDTAAVGNETKDLVKMVKEKTGINIEFTIIPNTNAGEVDKALVMLQAGDELDILYGTTPKLKTYYNAGVLTPVDDLAAAKNYNMKAVFGDRLPGMSDGKIYGLPAFNDIWVTLYNKKIFDDAGAAYPSAKDWTWSKYVETAKKITNASKKVWGSFMLDYDSYNYMLATQSGVQPYKADGTANFDDPAYKKSMQFFYDLGNKEKIQPSSVSYAANTYPWNSFVASDKMGMFVIGGWATSMLPNTEKYPRDWKCGMLPMPYPDGQQPSTLGITGCYAIPTTSKNKEAAFEAIKCIAENQYSLGYGRVPARIDLTDKQVTDYIEKKMVPTFKIDGITTEDIKTCWFDKNRKILPEKIVGAADSTISQIWIEEGQLYGQGAKSLDDAIAAIQKRANKAITDEKGAK